MTEKLVERLKPSAAVDHVPGVAVSTLRDACEPLLANRLNDWIVRNNDLKREAADALEAKDARIAELEAENERLRDGFSRLSKSDRALLESRRASARAARNGA